MAGKTSPSFTSHTAMPKPMQNGRGRGCRQRLSGNSLPGEECGWTVVNMKNDWNRIFIFEK